MTIPVVLDTDIGFDVDDVWALALLLECPEVDIRLITTCTGDTTYRATLVARLLEVAGRTDIPIGIGLPLDESPRTHSEWLGDYSLDSYAGTVIGDGIGAICDTIEAEAAQVTVIGIGPLPNVAAALSRAPDTLSEARFVGMHGSLRRGYLDAPKPMREYNVKQHSLSCQAVFRAPWQKVITPLDTCGNVILDGERFERVKQSSKAITQATLANHALWARDWPTLKGIDPERQSSLLFDTVAAYLAFENEWLSMEELPIVVTDDGKTLIDEAGDPVSCATEWRNKDAFLDFLVDRLV